MSTADVTGRLAGKVAIITGAGQTPGTTIGNGRAMALLFARAGARVICVDRDGDRAEATAAEVKASGGAATAVAADVAESGDAERIAAATLAEYGRIDVLVNNVGIGGGGDGPPKHLTEEAFDRILRVNLKGAWGVIPKLPLSKSL